MPVQGPFPVEFGAVFPDSVYAASGVEMVKDFQRSKGDLVQQADKTLDLYGHLYPDEMDRYADRLDSAADDAGKAKIRPDDRDGDGGQK